MLSTFKTTLKTWPVVFLAAGAICWLTKGVAGLFGFDLPEQQSLELVRRYAGWNLAFAGILLQVLVLAPVIEETLFRYLFWKLPAPKRARLAAVNSSLAFVAVHYFGQSFPDTAFLALFFFGLAQCWLYDRTGRLWAPMLNHALFNLTNLVGLFLLPQ